MELIIASHISRTFAAKRAVADLNLSISSGEIYGLVGPDGAGKTTALRLLCGALRPDRHSVANEAVQVHIAGIDLLSHTEQARRQIGYLPQRFSLYEELTVLENIRFFAEVRGLPAREWKPRCMEILNFVGLEQFIGRKAGQLSGGMKQKLGLAAALVHRPTVLLLDEPTTGVDPVTRQDFWQLIIRLVGADDNHPSGETIGGVDGIRPTGRAVLITTPYMDEAARCMRVGFMRQGRLVIEGPPGELCKQLDGQILEVTGQPLARVRKLLENRDRPAAGDAIEDVRMFGDRIHIRVRPGEIQGLQAYLQTWLPEQGIQHVQTRAIPAQLEDVFMSLTDAG